MSLRTSDYHYALPEKLIARHPAQRREDSRMMVIDRATGSWRHAMFREFPELLQPDELVVMNNAKVVPARFYSDDGTFEFLLLDGLETTTWRCLAKPGKKLRIGSRIVCDGCAGEVTEIHPEDGSRTIVWKESVPDLERMGHLPLPPYMQREAEEADQDRYQTVYAEKPGAVAAPTAGLHFSEEILKKIPHTFLTLHVGAGTFRPVQTESVEAHKMHEERFEIELATAEAINRAAKICAVGTTCVRVLESARRNAVDQVLPQQGATSIFLHPPKTIRHVGRLLTNFHLPCSTLLMLVSAFAGRELMLAAYEEAIREQYRFYSYGDCMLIG